MLEAFEQLQGEIAACRACRHDGDLGKAIEAGIAGGGVFHPLRNPLPYPPGSSIEQVRYLFVGMEPSSSAKNQEDAEARTRDGARNSCPPLFQFCVETYLLGPGEAWAFTDVAKCAMHLGRFTDETRGGRWTNCRTWFTREVVMFQPRALICLGDNAFYFLKDHAEPGWPERKWACHFSGNASGHRARYVQEFLRETAGKQYADLLNEAPPIASVEAWLEERHFRLGRAPYRQRYGYDFDFVLYYRNRFTRLKLELGRTQ